VEGVAQVPGDRANLGQVLPFHGGQAGAESLGFPAQPGNLLVQAGLSALCDGLLFLAESFEAPGPVPPLAAGESEPATRHGGSDRAHDSSPASFS
jgi:hypothetical protein